MPQKQTPPDWDAIAIAYAQNRETLKELGERFGVTAGAISKRASQESWPARKRVVKNPRRPGATFEWRLARALDKQITDLEQRWSRGEVGADTAQAEKEARTLSVLIRTAEKLKDIEIMAKQKTQTKNEDQQARDDRFDRKRLRETLERRLDQLIAAAHAHGLPECADSE